MILTCFVMGMMSYLNTRLTAVPGNAKKNVPILFDPPFLVKLF